MRIYVVPVLLAFVVTAWTHDAAASNRFGRKVLDVRDKASCKFVKVDDIQFPYLENDSVTVSCLAYRGTQRYYIEISVTNKGATPVQLDPGAIEFNKPGYTSYRTNALDAAREAAEAAGVPFEPTPPPVVGTTTTINVSETSTGNYSHATGTATTRPSADQGAANLGNAIGNAFAARHFAAAQSEAARFANFLMAFALDEVRGPIAPGETQIAVATFEQVKMKKAPFDVTVSVAGSEFVFRFQEWN